MPLYEYQCQTCRRTLEKRQKFSDAALTVCPHCGGHLEKLVSAPAIQFKGGGWYADGYGNKAAARSGASDGGGSGDGSSSGESSSTGDGKTSKSDAAGSAGRTDSSATSSASSDSSSGSAASTASTTAPSLSGTNTGK